MRITLPLLSAALLTIAAPSMLHAEDAVRHAMPPMTVGMTVKDPQGGVVGMITAMKGDLITLKTDKHEAQLPKASFTPDGDHALFGMSQAQLNAAIEQQLADAQAKIAPGAKVTGSQGTMVGTIESLDSQFATLKLMSGKVIKVPRSGLAPATDGARIGMTAADLEAQVAATTAPTTTAAE